MKTLKSSTGKEIYLDLQQVPGSKWVAVSFVPASEILQDQQNLTRTIIIIAVAAIVALSVMMFLLLRRLVIAPVHKLDNVAKHIAGGDLSVSLDYKSNDEFGTLAANFSKTVDRLHSYIAYIDEISGVLNEISTGNLTFTLTLDYVGEFAKIRDALDRISESLNDTISRIDQSSEQVSGGADQLSAGAQTLSQGATEQAAAVEELSATIAGLVNQVHENATDSRQVSKDVTSVAERVAQSNTRMQELIAAMSDINQRSHEIDHIIKTIDDIAFQTNILALNAAVEAARAGEAGKGFAVVADEVRNLAGKSAEAAKGTAELIQASVKAVERGSALADATASALATTVNDIKNATRAVDVISQASDQQAESISQVSLKAAPACIQAGAAFLSEKDVVTRESFLAGADGNVRGAIEFWRMTV